MKLSERTAFFNADVFQEHFKKVLGYEFFSKITIVMIVVEPGNCSLFVLFNHQRNPKLFEELFFAPFLEFYNPESPDGIAISEPILPTIIFLIMQQNSIPATNGVEVEKRIIIPFDQWLNDLFVVALSLSPSA